MKILMTGEMRTQWGRGRVVATGEVKKMQRFFFDVASHSCVRYDYQGREFASPDEARDFAELIAIDMGCSEDTEQAGEIQVRDIRGVELFSVKVQTSTLVAA